MNVKHKITSAGDNMPNIVYDVLIRIYDQIVLLKHFYVEDKRLLIMFNYLMTNFKKIWFN